jgi:hypothetical protein
MQSLDFITQIMCKKVDIVLLKYCMYENRYRVLSIANGGEFTMIRYRGMENCEWY